MNLAELGHPEPLSDPELSSIDYGLGHIWASNPCLYDLLPARCR